MIKVGVTGGIGSGKTLVCRVFETLGTPVFYADQQAKQLYDEDQELRNEMIHLFGPEIYGQNGLNRALLASKIFSDPQTLDRVNQLVHPRVRRKFNQWCQLHTDRPYLIEEAAVLPGSKNQHGLDYLILVYAPKEIRIQRVIERDQVSRASVERRMAHQVEDEHRMARADFVVYNDGSRMVLPQIIHIHQQLTDSA